MEIPHGVVKLCSFKIYDTWPSPVNTGEGHVSLSKERKPFVNGAEGCVRETREGCPARG